MKKNTPIQTIFYCCLFLISTFSSSLFAQSEFSDYPWLSDIVDTEDCCQNQTVTAYQSGVFTFIYIERGEDCQSKGNELYFENGTFYCADASNYDCRVAYNLLEENSTTLWNCGSSATNETFTICAGESVFLPAVQEFPIPPLGPSGPNGELPVQPCQPKLSAVDITPIDNTKSEDLKGFWVTPTETTTYEVFSEGFCGGPGSFNSDEAAVTYEVIIKESSECIVIPDTCKALVDLNINPSYCDQCISEVATYTYEGETYLVTIGDNEACSDAITTVMHCDSTVAFCYDGGIAGFAQCEKFFKEAKLLEVIWSKKTDCQTVPTPEVCLPLEALNIHPSFCESCIGEVAIYEYQKVQYLVTIENNPICSDGITTVTNCDSTFAFCFDGGIAGFSQCNDFFKEAILIETIWSRTRDCEVAVVEVAEPCTDLEGIDFGLCQAVMGVGIVKGKCTTISGCFETVVKGVDYSKAIFPTVEICEQTCNGDDGGNDSTPGIFETYPWLAEVVDLNDCKGTTVEVYDLGTFSFLFVQTETLGELYYENGGFYCMELPNYDCRALYNLGADQLTETWTCGDTGGPSEPSGPSSPVSGGGFVENNQVNTSTRITAFPNPTNGLVSVQLPKTQQQTVRVFDLFGRLVQEITTDANSLSIDLSGEDAGVYLVETWNDGERAVVKVVKQ
ncbi:MAG: T9SS type A sorting domain-containing protein [Saprospiraceae bacterium]